MSKSDKDVTIAEVVKNDENPTQKCFFITPIGESTGEIRRRTDGLIDSVINPILSASDIAMELVVAHRNHSTGDISVGIIKDIFTAKLVIADLTTLNPNVMYEVAIRDCLKKPIILIAEQNTSLPFDIKMMNTIMYKNDFQGVIDLQEQLKTYIKKIDFKNYEPENLITKANIDMDLSSAVNKIEDTEMKNVLNSILERLDKIEELNNNTMNKVMQLNKNHSVQISDSERYGFLRSNPMDQLSNYPSSNEIISVSSISSKSVDRIKEKR